MIKSSRNDAPVLVVAKECKRMDVFEACDKNNIAVLKDFGMMCFFLIMKLYIGYL